MFTVKSVFGNCEQQEFETIAEKVYELFRIPLCKLHIQKAEGKAFLCGLEPLNETQLSKSDVDIISREISLISQQEETLSVKDRMFC
jgi:hypothetical protein